MKGSRRATSRFGRVAQAVLTALTLGLTTGCVADVLGTAGPKDDRPVVLTTFTVIADIAQNVAGDRLRVVSITKTGAEIHGYEPTPRDVARASEADMILNNGLNLEAWFGQFVETLDVPRVVVSAGIEAIDIAGDAYAGKPNPHAWMSTINAQIYVDNIVAAFSELDPAYRAEFAENGEAYKRELDAVHQEMITSLEALPPHQRALVSCEGAFSYLARDVGLTEKYIWPVNAEAQATPQQITSVIEFVRDNEVPAVFCESTVSDDPMQEIVRATDASFGGTLYVDSLSAPDGPVPTYLDLIRHDADVIVTALTGGTPHVGD